MIESQIFHNLFICTQFFSSSLYFLVSVFSSVVWSLWLISHTYTLYIFNSVLTQDLQRAPSKKSWMSHVLLLLLWNSAPCTISSVTWNCGFYLFISLKCGYSTWSSFPHLSKLFSVRTYGKHRLASEFSFSQNAWVWVIYTSIPENHWFFFLLSTFIIVDYR